MTYTGQGGIAVDYLKVPVENSTGGGVFTVNGGGGATLQVSGTDANTNNVSFYQNASNARTIISGNGTLWCTDNYTMTDGSLETPDAETETLQVGTAGNQPVDGTVTLTGGNVSIDPNPGAYGTLQIVGTTAANMPILNVGTVAINFNVDMTAGSNKCTKLYVGFSNGTGKTNFNYDGGATGVSLHPQGEVTTGHKWQIIFFGSKTGDVSVDPPWTKVWNPNNLEIDH